MNNSQTIKQYLKQLESHLKQENPMLVSVIQQFKKIDAIAKKIGLLNQQESYASQISWWPMISILGTFSAGKSSFINRYIHSNIQSTGNQAVDDRFTVLCYSGKEEAKILPGIALDADPRFPFYQISKKIDEVAAGEGNRIDSYIQLKSIPSETLRGKILIDSPGFDADEQRTSTLKIVDHIIDLSDLVLVFFDARHPEPGAMQDTLSHLVENTIHRNDSSKFLYILNQIDTTAQEDNAEEVVGAWQRALAQKGLITGRFHTIYNPDVAVTIHDEDLRIRYANKSQKDTNDILSRIDQVSVERIYRIISQLEHITKDIEQKWIPKIEYYKNKWTKKVLWTDLFSAIFISAGVIGSAYYFGFMQQLNLNAKWAQEILSSTSQVAATTIGLFIAILTIHYINRNNAKSSVLRIIDKDIHDENDCKRIKNAFRKNTRFWRSVFETNPSGWSRWTKRRLTKILATTNGFVRSLNDKFTNPSGKGIKTQVNKIIPEVSPPTNEIVEGDVIVRTFNKEDIDTELSNNKPIIQINR